MKVQATRLGFYNHKRRREGSVFRLRKSEDFSKQWMVELKGKQAKVEIEEELHVSPSVQGQVARASHEPSTSDQEVI
jgi:hypothetical protein